MRNGVVAETLRNAGDCHNVIFGLQLPDLTAIARELEPSEELAEALWADSGVRESRLLACYLMPHEAMTPDKAIGMAASTRTREEGDILAFRLLRHLDFAPSLARTLLAGKDDNVRHTATALCRFVDPAPEP